MGRYTPSRADTLCRGENKGGDKVWQILDDTPWRSSAKLGRYEKSSYADAEKKPLP